MRSILKLGAAGLLGATVSACSISEARIAVPSELSVGVERLEVSGMGGGRKGDFRFAGAPGTFSRSADRLGVMDDHFVQYRGGGSFDLAASQEAPPMSARCGYGESRVQAGPISVTSRGFTYVCELSSGGAPSGRLIIHDANGPLGSANGRSEREGTFDYKGQRLAVRSIHRLEGSPLPVQAPLGYLFLADGRAIGAVDLNGTGKTILAPRSPEFREAVIAAGIALSILWDPAEVQRTY